MHWNGCSVDAAGRTTTVSCCQMPSFNCKLRRHACVATLTASGGAKWQQQHITVHVTSTLCLPALGCCCTDTILPTRMSSMSIRGSSASLLPPLPPAAAAAPVDTPDAGRHQERQRAGTASQVIGFEQCLPPPLPPAAVSKSQDCRSGVGRRRETASQARGQVSMQDSSASLLPPLPPAAAAAPPVDSNESIDRPRHTDR